MGRASRVDGNQASIVDGLRDIGATVQVLSSVRGGCPDLLVGFRGANYLLEIKPGDLASTKRQNELTRHELGWHLHWNGQVDKVESLEQALRVIGALVEDGTPYGVVSADRTAAEQEVFNLLTSALEHASHGWHGLEVARRVSSVNYWPPDNVNTFPHSPEWYLANTIRYVKQAYDLVAASVEDE